MRIMESVTVQSGFSIASWFSRYFISQSSFDTWASGTKPRNVTLLGVLLLLVATACFAAIAIMGPRLAREGTLLWFGTHADGKIANAEVVEAGKFKNGAQKYRLTLAYDFIASDGKNYTGSTQRSDLRTLPELKPGDAVGVYYNPSSPLNSVADYNLRTDVYALLLFLPWIAIFGIAAPFAYVRRWWQWRRSRAAGHTNRKTTS